MTTASIASRSFFNTSPTHTHLSIVRQWQSLPMSSCSAFLELAPTPKKAWKNLQWKSTWNTQHALIHLATTGSTPVCIQGPVQLWGSGDGHQTTDPRIFTLRHVQETAYSRHISLAMAMCHHAIVTVAVLAHFSRLCDKRFVHRRHYVYRFRCDK